MGRIFTKAQEWRLTVDGEDVTVVLSDSELPLSLEESEALRVTRGFFWSSVEIPLEGRTPIILDGIPNLTIVSSLVSQRRNKQQRNNTMTSGGPKAQGKSVMRPGLTGSLLRTC